MDSLLLLVPIEVTVWEPLIQAQRSNMESVPLNRLRIFAISLFILFSSNSLTRAPRMSAMNWTHRVKAY